MIWRKRVLLLFAVVAVISVSLFIILRNPGEKEILKAGIVDGLSEEFPNPQFVSEATQLLGEAGYQVEYLDSSQITVSFYENLPEKGYHLLILRVHSAPMDLGKTPGAALFTTESQEGKYFAEQLLGWVRMGRTLTRGDRYYAVTPAFFREGMKGEFDETVIITMSCYGTVDDTLARAFTTRGASTFIGWSEKVTSQHMDEATAMLLEEHLNQRKPLEEAVESTKEKLGGDPAYGGQLVLYQTPL
jgi:hypothetical protein